MTNKQSRRLLLILCIITITNTFLFCPPGQVSHSTECIDCSILPHTQQIKDYSSTPLNSCKCQADYYWSSNTLTCKPITSLISDNNSNNSTLYSQSQELQQTQDPEIRQLTVTCDPLKGFILVNGMCLNCRNIPNTVGNEAYNSTACYCRQDYQWVPQAGTCQCGDKYFYAYLNGSACINCAYIPDQTVQNQCQACYNGGFGWSDIGCVNCSAIPQGISSVGYDCTCKTGYVWNSKIGECVCSSIDKYANSGAGCVACNSLSNALQSSCNACSAPFIHNNYICEINTFIFNFNTTSNSCPVGSTIYTDPLYSRKVRCVCTLGTYYQSGTACLACSSSAPGGSTACTSCANANGYFASNVGCFYCGSIAGSTTVATQNGCTCLLSYYWNAETSTCDCDFWNNYYKGPNGNCINCSAISGTDIIATPKACTCLPGFVWNPTDLTCGCDTTKGSFMLNNVCINCLLIKGSVGYAGNNACSCLPGYIWDSVNNICICNSAANFFNFNGSCVDCGMVENSNGFASKYGCSCINGMIWSNVNGCSCPSGYVNINGRCQSCSTATLHSGATVSGCQSCSNSQGFVKTTSGICYQCASQPRTAPTANGNKCNCANTTMVWQPDYAACVCNFNNYVYNIETGGSISCQGFSSSSCSYTDGYSWDGNMVCTQCSTVPNSNGTGGYQMCGCKAGYLWEGNTYPFTCQCDNSQNMYQKGNTCSPCSTTACKNCDPAGGYILLFNTQNATCLLCSGFPNTIGTATITGCNCVSGMVWDQVQLACVSSPCPALYNPNTGKCQCNLTTSIYSQTGGCINCNTIPYSTNLSASTSTCGCSTGYIWKVIQGVGICTCNTFSSCNCSSSSIFINGACFSCNISNSSGPLPNNTCKCVSPFIWNSQTNTCSSSCTTDSTTTLTLNSLCINCSNLKGSTGLAGNNNCGCIPGFFWDPIFDFCRCDYTQNFYLINNTCTDCSTVDNSVGTASSFGCNCLQGFIWVNSTIGCGCPTGYANVAGKCVQCSTWTLPNGVTLSGCQTCNNSQGFYKSSTGICYYCKGQLLTSGVATASGCACSNYSLIWQDQYSACVCNLYTNVYSQIVNGQPTCSACTATYCSCNYATYSWDGGSVCTTCNTVPGSNGVGGYQSCGCSAGKSWVGTTYPFSCQCSYYNNYYTSGTNCFSCNSTTNYTACNLCDWTQGYTLVYSAFANTVQCLLCSAIPNTNGSSATGCICSNGSWNPVTLTCSNILCSSGTVYNPNTQKCDCNLTISILNPNGICIACSTFSNSNGFANSSRACGCSSGYVWKTTVGGGCQLITAIAKSSICDITTSIFINGICYDCTTVVYSTGPKVGDPTQCSCSNSLVFQWQPLMNIGTCTCSDPKMIFVLNPSTSSGVCECPPGTKLDPTGTSCICPTPLVWTNNQCKCKSNSALTINFDCLDCGLFGLYDNYQCNCQNNYVWSHTYSACRLCSSIAFVGTTTHTMIKSIACECHKKNMYWDIVRQGCFTKCTTADSACLVCTNAPFSTGVTVPLSSISPVNLPGGLKVATAYANANTNYRDIYNYACECITGYVWDSNRFLCHNNTMH